jgi:hypothetical protein
MKAIKLCFNMSANYAAWIEKSTQDIRASYADCRTTTGEARAGAVASYA